VYLLLRSPKEIAECAPPSMYYGGGDAHQYAAPSYPPQYQQTGVAYPNCLPHKPQFYPQYTPQPMSHTTPQ
jgi:hypothetical protein